MSDIQNNLEQLFRDRFNDFEANVDPSVWEAVQSQIPAPSAPPTDGGLAQTGGKVIFGQFSTSTVVTVTSIAAAAVIAFGIYNYTTEEEMPTLQNRELVEQEESIGPNIELQKDSEPEEQDQLIVVQEEQDAENEKVISNELTLPKGQEEGTTPEMDDLQDIVNSIANEPSNDQIDLEKHNASLQVEGSSSPNSVVPNEVDDAGVVENGGLKDEETEQVIPPVDELEILTADIEHERIAGDLFSVQFKNLGQGSYHEWDLGDGTFSIEDDPKHTFSSPGEYTIILTVRSQDGRIRTDEAIVKVFEPSSMEEPDNVLTPNGDYMNDVLDIRGENMQKVSILVHDMQGDQVFVSDSFENDWDGKDMNGRPLPQGNYLLVVNAIGFDGEIHTKKTLISLYR